MDIPISRKYDWKWLLRNLAIRNALHPNFYQVSEIIKKKNKESKK